MSDFVSSLNTELQRLEDELRRDPRYRRIERIKDLLVEYGPRPPVAAPAEPTAAASAPLARPVIARRGRKKLSKAKAVERALRSYLADKGPTHRKILLEHLKQLRLMGGEKNPMSNLAAYLSEWRNIFATDGNGNFSLKSAEPSRDRELPLSH